jgi:hypothetical protein
MGTQADQQHRGWLRRDDNWLQTSIDKIRQWIFEKGVGVESKKIGHVFDETSLVPTWV